tara:strand:+ start:327 stop:434 length:108 start_codon:yes stop_codon:yes gene_type:complete
MYDLEDLNRQGREGEAAIIKVYRDLAGIHVPSKKG